MKGTIEHQLFQEDFHRHPSTKFVIGYEQPGLHGVKLG
jgi:hypothetical protein